MSARGAAAALSTGFVLGGGVAMGRTPLGAVARLWNWEPALLGLLLYPALVYALGAKRLWRRAGAGRGVGTWRVLAFAAEILVLLVALVSPLDALADLLFSAHMVQHLLLVLVAAPLLALSAPGFVMLWGLPLAARRAVACLARPLHPWWEAATRPAVTWGLFAVTIWLWHLPALYDAALGNAALHRFEHLCFLVTAWLFWWQLLHPLGRRSLSRGADVLYVFTASLQGSALGALLTFAPRPLYAAYATSHLTTLTPLQDQQLAGLLMWVPSGVLFLALAAAFFAAWLNETGAVPLPARKPGLEGGER